MFDTLSPNVADDPLHLDQHLCILFLSLLLPFTPNLTVAMTLLDVTFWPSSQVLAMMSNLRSKLVIVIVRGEGIVMPSGKEEESTTVTLKVSGISTSPSEAAVIMMVSDVPSDTVSIMELTE